MIKRFPTALLLLVLPAILGVPLLSACGGDDDSASSQGKTPSGATPRASTAVKADAEIDQQGLQFVPAKVTIKIGQSVLIKNSEDAIHNAKVNGKDVTGNMKKGDSVAWKATQAGTFTLTCDYHPQMKATIEVTP